MQNVKRKVFTGAMALLLAASVSAGVSSKAFAAQKSKEKLPEKYIQGYLVKDGKKTPVYNNTPKSKTQYATSPYEGNYPKLAEDPYAPAPGSGSTTTKSADMKNIIYFKYEGFKAAFKEGEEKRDAAPYLEKKSDGTIEMGVYDPKTGELSNLPFTLENQERAKNGEEWMVNQYGPSMAWSKAFDGTSKLKRDSKYKLLGTSVVNNSAEWWSGLDIKHGVNTTESYSLAWTVGFKISVEAGGGVVPGKTTTEFSTELTNQFGSEITISDEVTYKDQTRVPKADNPDYQYNVYRGALYQLESTYTLEPGTGLKELMSAGGMNNLFTQGLANPKFAYNEKELYYPVTPGSHLE
ncbi:hypothetical protein SAMN05444487_1059 [Marininema mesophilum]|uniref:Uncharacterized protein n=1 Tax=Marininema mesophilum TaxID=1048340 RepID=A0A1H2V817_9BACL|nr:hypothetical protein [Marininema mesophilum]SDW64029.1 hypothetical protein SAMN05444487_1059 [Marininema mesophilum]